MTKLGRQKTRLINNNNNIYTANYDARAAASGEYGTKFRKGRPCEVYKREIKHGLGEKKAGTI